MSKIRIIYDECTPTKDRRPTFADDIRNDIHVEEFESNPDSYEELIGIIGYDTEYFEEDVLENAEEMSFEDKFKALIDYIAGPYHDYSDPGDGSPNILYLGVDGETLLNDPYWTIDDLDLANISEEELIDAMLASEGYKDSDEDEQKYYSYEDAIKYLEDKGINCDPGDEQGSYVCELMHDQADGRDEKGDFTYLESTLNYIARLAEVYE